MRARRLVWGMVIGSILVTTMTQVSTALATSTPDWTVAGQATINQQTTINPKSSSNRNGCVEKTIKLRYMASTLDTVVDQKTCVVTGKYVSIADTAWGIAVSFQSDQYFYLMVNYSGISNIQPVPGGDRVGIEKSVSGYRYVSFYDNFALRLQFQPSSLRYKFINWSNPLYPKQGDAGGLYVALSNNGRYAVYQRSDDYPGTNQRLVRVDLESGEVKQFGRLWYSYYASSIPRPHYAISNDGSSIVGGGPFYLKFWRVNDSCLIDVPNYSDGTMSGDCTNRVVQNDYIGEALNPQSSKSVARLSFNDAATELSFVYYRSNESTYYMNISPPGYPKAPTIDYLALGDSFSSGEGDYAKGGTSNYTGGSCHLSLRSYPYLLRDRWGINSDRMENVACSGTMVDPDYIAPIDEYLGQNNRLVRYDDKDGIKRRALEVFVPGYAPQLEFVKKYQPKTLTLTGGGNDVGFGEKLEECANSQNETCDYVADASRRSEHGTAMFNMFDRLTALYDSIKKASPQTKIYVLGYPKFVNENSVKGSCLSDAGWLNSDEKKYINLSIEYLNRVIKSAAEYSGVVYIDIEDALQGGKICDLGGEYVTGVLDIIDVAGVIDGEYLHGEDTAQLFHPNHLGHEKIAEAITAQLNGYTLQSYPYTQVANESVQAPQLSEYFGGEPLDIIIKSTTLVDDKPILNQSTTLSINDYGLEPGRDVLITGHSEPVDLGTFKVNSKGGLNVDIILPESMGPGYHTIEVTGRSYSGEPIKYYQIVLVQATDENDRDGDGIDDSVDRCMFMEGGGEDELSIFCDMPAEEPIERGKTTTDEDVVITVQPEEEAGLAQKLNDDTLALGQNESFDVSGSQTIEMDEGTGGVKPERDDTSDTQANISAFGDLVNWRTILFLFTLFLGVGVIYLAKVRSKNVKGKNNKT